jgi:DNA-binding LacI/PurR family transcriptional regulator
MRASGLGDAACVVGGEYTETAGAHAMHALLRSALPPTAVFAANDLSAIGAIDLIEREHCNVPTDVSMIGFDNTALSGLNHIGLTTVAQPSTAMGRRATEMLVGNLNGDAPLEHVVMAPQLVLRGTTCRPAT